MARGQSVSLLRGERFGNRKEARQFDRDVLGNAQANLTMMQGVVGLVTVGLLWLVDGFTKLDPTQPLLLIPALSPMLAVLLANLGLLVLMVPARFWRQRHGGTTPYFTSLTNSRIASRRLGWAALILGLPTSALAYWIL